MKTIINKIKYCSLIFLVIVSCSEIGDDPAFDTSASERATEAANEAMSKLTSSTEGWVFEYYPDNTQQYGGYNYIVDFNTNKMVDVYSERQSDFSTPVSSTYDILSIGGPILSFDTYNSELHYFSTPSAALYQARGGDYEFIISNSEDENVLNARGTFTGNNLKLIKLNETPQSYLTKVKSTIDYLSGAAYLITKDGETLQIPVLNRNMTFPPTSGEVTENTVIAFIHTPSGIKLYEPITVNGNMVSEFTLDKVKKQLISLDGNTIIDLLFPPINASQNWTINVVGTGEVSTTFFNTFVTVYNANTTRYAETLSTTISFGNTRTPTGIQFFSFSNPTTGAGFTAEYNVTFPLLLNSPSLLSIVRKGAGFNWSFYTHLDPMINLIVDNQPYKVEGTPVDNPTVAKLTSNANPNVWFTIRR